MAAVAQQQNKNILRIHSPRTIIKCLGYLKKGEMTELQAEMEGYDQQEITRAGCLYREERDLFVSDQNVYRVY